MLSVLSVLSVPAFSAPPQSLSFQGKLGDNSGNPLSGSYSFRFCLLDAPTGGTQIFCEDWNGANAVNVANGVYSVLIGTLTPGGIPASDFGNPLYLEIDVQQGASLTAPEVLSPRIPLSATAYSFQATLAYNVSGIVPPAHGGTGQDFSSIVPGAILYSSAAGSIAALSTTSQTGYILTSISGMPVWQPVGASFLYSTNTWYANQIFKNAIFIDTDAVMTGSLSGAASVSAGAFYGSGAGLTNVSTATFIPDFILPPDMGGTGADLAAAQLGDLPYFTGSGIMNRLPAGPSGYILESNGAAAPQWAAPAQLLVNVYNTTATWYAQQTFDNELFISSAIAVAPGAYLAIGGIAPTNPLSVGGNANISGTLSAANLSGALPWSDLAAFPAACSTGTFVSTLAGSPVCQAATPYVISSTSIWTAQQIFNNELFISSTVSLNNAFFQSNSTVAAAYFQGNAGGLTGSAGISITGNANTATNLAGGGPDQIPYQNALNQTLFVPAPTSPGQLFKWTGTSFTWNASQVTNAVYAQYLENGTTGQIPVETGYQTTGFLPSMGAGGIIVGQGTSVVPATAAVSGAASLSAQGVLTLSPTQNEAINWTAPQTWSAPAALSNSSLTLTGPLGYIVSQSSITGSFFGNGSGLSNLNASAVASGLLSLSFGGTGADLSGQLPGALPYFASASSMAALSPAGAIGGSILTWTGSSIAWQNSNVSSATWANNLSSGAAGELPYQSGPNATAFTAPGTAGYLLVSSGPSAAPWWTTQLAVAQNLLSSTNAWTAQQTFDNEIFLSSGASFNNAPIAMTGSDGYIYSQSSVTASYFSGSGAGLSNLQAASISGTVAQASTSTWALNLLGGAANSIPYQSGSSTSTSFIAAPSASPGQILAWTGSSFTWQTSDVSSATWANNLSSGAAGEIPYQSAPNATAFTAPGTAGYLLVSSGPSAAPEWASQLSVAQNLLSSTNNWNAQQTFNNELFISSGIALSSAPINLSGSNGYIYSQSSVTASYFSGSGAGLSNLQAASISGTVAQASTSTWALNLLGGAANSIPYQSGSSTSTSFIAAPSASPGQILAWTGSSFTWQTSDVSSASWALNLSSGALGEIPYQSGPNSTAFSPQPTGSGQVLFWNGANPAWSASTAAASQFFYFDNSGNFVWTSNLPANQLAGTVPSANLSGAYGGVTGLGTIASGLWQASPIAPKYGGTGADLSSALYGEIPYFTSSGSMSYSNAPPGINYVFLGNNGTAPSWATELAVAQTLLPANNIWTSSNTFTLLSSFTGPLAASNSASFGSGGQISTFTAAGALELASPLSPQYGGTGANLAGQSQGALPYFASASSMSALAPPSAAQAGAILTWSGSSIAWQSSNVSSASWAAALIGGDAGEIPWQTGPSSTSFSAPGTAGYLLVSSGPAAAPWWITQLSVAQNLLPHPNDWTALQTFQSSAAFGSGAQISTFTASGALELSSPLALAYGGTGADLSSASPGSLLFMSTTVSGAVGAIPSGTNGYILQLIGGSPTWAPLVAGTTATYADNLANGGPEQIPYQTGAGQTSFLPAGAANQILVGNGNSSPPAWQDLASVLVATATWADNLNGPSGTAAGAIPYQTGTSATAFTIPGTNGQLLESAGGGAPAWIDQASLAVGTANELAGGSQGAIPYQGGAGTTFLNGGSAYADFILQMNQYGSSPTWTSTGTIFAYLLNSSSTWNAQQTFDNEIFLSSGASFNNSPITMTGSNGYINSGSTVTAAYFSGNGGGLTNVPGGSVAGAVASASTATYALYLSSGFANAIPYQTGESSTSFVPAPPSGLEQIFTWTGTSFTWQASNVSSATWAKNLANGAAWQIPYQNGAGSTVFLASPTNAGQVVSWENGQIAWHEPSIGSTTWTQSLLGGTTGQLVYQTGVSSTGFLASGGLGQVLLSGGPAPNAPAWADQSTLAVGSATAATTLLGASPGALPYQYAAGSTTWLSGGASVANYILQMNSGGSAPAWQPLSNILLNSTNTWTAEQIFDQSITLQGSSLTISGFGSGYALGLSSGVYAPAGTVTANLFQGSGAGLSNLEAPNLLGIVPQADLSGPYGQVTGLGVVSSGTWQAGIIEPKYGGTGADLSNAYQWGIPYFAASTGTMSSTLAPAQNDSILIGNTSGAPVWQSSAAFFGQIFNSTNTWTATQNFAAVSASAFSGNGSGITNISASNIDSGVLPVAYGGTSTNTFTQWGVLVGNNQSAVLASGAGINGQILTAVTAGVPVWEDPSSAITNATATYANNLAKGGVGEIPVQYGYSNTTFLPAMGVGGIIVGQGTSVLPSTAALQGESGAITVSTGTGDVLIALNPVQTNSLDWSAPQTFSASPTGLAVSQSATVGGTMTVSGSAFSVGASTLAVSAGQVGIGTASPGAGLALDVNGAARASGLLSLTASGTGLSVSNNAVIGGPGFSVGTSSFVVTNGQVGVGTSSPGAGYALDVNGAERAQSLTLVNPLALADGGTGASLSASNGQVVYSAASSLALTSGAGASAGYLLQYNGAGSAPTWISPSDLTALNAVNLSGGTTGYIPVQANTSSTTFLPAMGVGGIVVGQGTGAMPSTATLQGLAGEIVISTGPGTVTAALANPQTQPLAWNAEQTFAASPTGLSVTNGAAFNGSVSFPGSGIWNASGSVGIGNAAPTGLFEVGAGTMTVLSSGNVGIGTTSPAGPLDVALTANTTAYIGTSAVASVLQLTNGSLGSYASAFVINGTARAGTAAPIAMGTGIASFGSAPSQLYLATNGDVGIGTASPGAALDVSGDAQFGSTAKSTFTAAGALELASALTVPNGGTGQSSFASGEVLYGNGAGAVSATSGGANGNVLAMGPSGVPIWSSGVTVSSASNLANASIGEIPVQQASGETTFLPAMGAGGIIVGQGTSALPSTGTLTGETGEITVSQTASGLYLALANPQTQALTWNGAQSFSGGANFPGSGIWNTSGNVGIGTASPAYPLDVNGNVMIRGNYLYLNNAASGPLLYGDATNMVMQLGPSNGSIQFKNNSGTAMAAISVAGNSYFDGGNVGVSTGLPQAPLDVETQNASGYSLQLSSGLYAPNGTITANLFVGNFSGNGSDLTGVKPSGAASGDLAGNYPSPTLAPSIATGVTWSSSQTFNGGAGFPGNGFWTSNGVGFDAIQNANTYALKGDANNTYINSPNGIVYFANGGTTYANFSAGGGNLTIAGALTSQSGTSYFGASGNSRVQVNSGGGANAVSEYFSTEANPRWQIGRDLLASGQAALGFGVGGASALDAYIGRDSSGNLQLETGGLNARLTVTSGGGVGVGTLQPGALLDVGGNAQFGSTAKSTFTAAGALELASALGTQYGGTGQNFSGTAQGSVLYFSGTGAMAALGPSSPAGYLLQSNGSGANPSWVSPSGLTASTATWATNLSNGGAGVVPYQSAAGATGFTAQGASGDVLLSGGAGSPTWALQSSLVVGTASYLTGSPQPDALTWNGAQTFSGGANFPGSGIWNASGNVGIGTASPTQGMLVVSNPATSTGVYVGSNIGYSAPNIRAIGYNTGAQGGAGIELGDGGANSVNMFIWRTTGNDFEINTSGASTNDLYIQPKRNLLLNSSGGNVGIGTASPAHPLEIDDVNSTIGLANAALNIQNASGSQSSIYFSFGASPSQSGSIRADSSGNLVLNAGSSNIYLDYDFGSQPTLVPASGGAASTLTVNGNMIVDDNLTVSGIISGTFNGTVNGNVNADQVNAGSFQNAAYTFPNALTVSGALGGASETLSGTLGVTGAATFGNSIGGSYGLTPGFAAWSAYGTGADGAAIYNDNGTYKGLMVVGNNFAGGGAGSRYVGIWDVATVATSLGVGMSIPTTPSYTLQVNGTLDASGAATLGSNLSVAGTSSLNLLDVTGTGTALSVTNSASVGGTLSVTGAATLSGGATFPGSGIWNTSGNVGIGNAAPSYRLQIQGLANALDVQGSANDIANFVEGATGANPYNKILWHTGTPTSGPSDYFTWYINENNTITPQRAISLWQYPSDSLGGCCHEIWVAGMDLNTGQSYFNVGGSSAIFGNSSGVWAPSGNVGIGTTSPGRTLDVNGAGSFVSPNSGTTGGVIIRDNSSNTGDYLQFVNNADSAQYGYIQGLSAGGLALMGGNVGIGTASPIASPAGSLTVAGSTFFGTGGTYLVDNSGQATMAGGVQTVASLGLVPTSDNTGLIGNGTAGGQAANRRWAQIHAVTIYGNSVAGPDLAERYPGNVEPGDVVVLSRDPKAGTIFDQSRVGSGDTASGRRIPSEVEKTRRPYQEGLFGVVSTVPGIKLGDPNDETSPPIALTGRVPVKVTLENGPIKIGDYLTSSSKPGYAMKATEPGPVVGIALEAFSQGEEGGKILCFVHPERGMDAVGSPKIEKLQGEIEALKAEIEKLKSR